VLTQYKVCTGNTQRTRCLQAKEIGIIMVKLRSPPEALQSPSGWDNRIQSQQSVSLS